MKHAFMLMLSIIILMALVATLGVFLRHLRGIEVERWGYEKAQPTLRPLLRRLVARLRFRS